MCLDPKAGWGGIVGTAPSRRCRRYEDWETRGPFRHRGQDQSSRACRGRSRSSARSPDNLTTLCKADAASACPVSGWFRSDATRSGVRSGRPDRRRTGLPSGDRCPLGADDRPCRRGSGQRDTWDPRIFGPVMEGARHDRVAGRQLARGWPMSAWRRANLEAASSDTPQAIAARRPRIAAQASSSSGTRARVAHSSAAVFLSNTALATRATVTSG